MQDLQFALRQVRRSPRFAAIVVLTVALGIGANTAIFSTLNGFLRPLPVRSPEQLVVLAAQLKNDETGMRYRFSFLALNDLRRQADRFSDVFGFSAGMGGLDTGRRVVPLLYSTVTGNYFPALGMRPAAGRLFFSGEGERPGVDTPIVLGYAFWQRNFAGNPAVIGRQFRLDGHSARVIGVVPKDFLGTWAGVEMDAYVPVNAFARLFTTQDFFADRDCRALTLMGRLKPGVTLREAQSSMDVIARRLQDDYPAAEKDLGIRVVPEPLARPVPVRFMAESLPLIRLFLLALAAMVLLLACMNVANLVMVRSSSRQREMAIRVALGSGRGRLVRQMLIESGLLALLGTAAGLLFGKWGNRVFVSSIHAGTSLPVKVVYSFDWRVFCYALAAAVFTVAVIGLFPALRTARSAVSSGMRDGGWGGSVGRAGLRMRSALVVAQVAASLMLLIVAGILVRGLQHAQRLDLGFQADHVLNVRLNPHDLGYTQEHTREFYRELTRRVRAVPGVESVSQAFSVPLGYVFDSKPVYVEGRPLAPGDRAPQISGNAIDGDYFGTMRIPLVRGRVFREDDDENAPRVAIVNQTMAARFWPGQNPIGKRFAIERGGRLLEVVGVAHDSKYLVIFESPLPYFYVPLAQNFYFMRVLQVRTVPAPERFRARVENEIRALDPDLPLADFQTMAESLDGFFGFRMFAMGAQQAAAMGLLGLVLAVIGVYGVVSYGAAQRTHEIGIRMALGAEPVQVLVMILRHGAWLVAGGVVFGIAAASVFTTVATRVLPLVDRTDPVAFGVVTLLLALITLWACYVPARRAMRVDPVVALRHE